MGQGQIDYAAVIRDLEQKRAQMNARFDAAIAAMRHVMALEAPAVQPNLLMIPRAIRQAKRSAHRSGSMVDAAMKYLAAHQPVPNVELAKALERGGFAHKSKSFPNTLNSVLRRRAMTVGDIRKSERGWELVGYSAG
jgi:hypothetical protein